MEEAGYGFIVRVGDDGTPEVMSVHFLEGRRAFRDWEIKAPGQRIDGPRHVKLDQATFYDTDTEANTTVVFVPYVGQSEIGHYKQTDVEFLGWKTLAEQQPRHRNVSQRGRPAALVQRLITWKQAYRRY